jgi:TPR repeat protein
MEWTKRVCKDPFTGEILADPAEFYYDIGKRLVLGKEEGMEVNRNVTRGIECLMRAAELGHAAAGWDLQCFTGAGGDAGGLRLDYVKAAQLYQKHVDLGNCMAQSNLGVCYHKGRGIEQNLDKAVDLYKLAAEQGYPRALYNLAVCYDLGEGVEANIPKAVELYHQSAQGGYAVAQYYMGVCFLNGKGLKAKDPARAIEMWTRAANQGHAFAQYSLAQSYRDGTGVEKDLLKAASYFVAFTRWGDESGWDCLKNLLSRPLDNPYYPPVPQPYFGQRRSSISTTTLNPPTLSALARLQGSGLSHSAPSSPVASRPSFLPSMEQREAMSAPAPAPYYHCFAERKKSRFEDNFHVPNLYDLCCLYFHTQWTRNLSNASGEAIAEEVSISGPTNLATGGREEEMLPAEVRHRIKYENVYCCRPKCRKFFFGSGRVQRTFQLRAGAGGSEAEHDDVVLHFCSLECAAFDLTPDLGAGCKE